MMPIIDACVYVEKSTYELDDYLEAPIQFHVLRMVAKQSPSIEMNSLSLEYLQKQAQTPGSGGFPNAIIANVDLSQYQQIEALCELGGLPNLRGVNHGSNVMHTLSDYESSLELLAKNNLSLELVAEPANIEILIELASIKPELVVVIQTCNACTRQPNGLTIEQYRLLSQQENININFCTPIDTISDSNEYQASVLAQFFDLFGFERIMFGSGFRSKQSNDLFDQVWKGYADACARVSARHRDGLFRSNANRVYDL